MEILNQDNCHFKDIVALKEKLRKFAAGGSCGVQVCVLCFYENIFYKKIRMFFLIVLNLMIFFTKESELHKFINYIILEDQQNMSVL